MRRLTKLWFQPLTRVRRLTLFVCHSFAVFSCDSEGSVVATCPWHRPTHHTSCINVLPTHLHTLDNAYGHALYHTLVSTHAWYSSTDDCTIAVHDRRYTRTSFLHVHVLRCMHIMHACCITHAAYIIYNIYMHRCIMQVCGEVRGMCDCQSCKQAR